MSAAPAAPVEVGDLDTAALLALAEANEREIRERELLRLELAYEWAVRHPATEESGVETPAGPVLQVLEAPETLGGEGTPEVAAFTPEAFAARLGMTPRAGALLIADVLDLRHRLPLLWKRVRRLAVPAWQARRVAQQTRRLPRAGARWVDARLAARSDGSLGPVVTDRLVAEAAAAFDPQTQQGEEEAAEAAAQVRLRHPDRTDYRAASDLTATGDTLVLTGFHDLVCALAHRLHLAGDPRPLGVRKIHAIALITILATRALTGDPPGDTGPGDTGPGDTSGDLSGGTSLEPGDLAQAARQAGKVKLIAHVEAADLDTDAEGGTALAVGRIERLGAATLAKIRAWVGHHQVQVLPVLNMARRDAVDQHDPPEWMAELVRLRDEHCIFPGCTVDARDCDLDHQTAYLPLEDGGPPGQTHPDALACLCRRHHRAKTAGSWRYHRTPDGYLWHGPHGATYLVTPQGTRRLSSAD